jgi:hypothetical protein
VIGQGERHTLDNPSCYFSCAGTAGRHSLPTLGVLQNTSAGLAGDPPGSSITVWHSTITIWHSIHYAVTAVLLGPWLCASSPHVLPVLCCAALHIHNIYWHLLFYGRRRHWDGPTCAALCCAALSCVQIPNLSVGKQAAHLDNVKREIQILKKLRGTLRWVGPPTPSSLLKILASAALFLAFPVPSGSNQILAASGSAVSRRPIEHLINTVRQRVSGARRQRAPLFPSLCTRFHPAALSRTPAYQRLLACPVAVWLSFKMPERTNRSTPPALPACPPARTSVLHFKAAWEDRCFAAPGSRKDATAIVCLPAAWCTSRAPGRTMTRSTSSWSTAGAANWCTKWGAAHTARRR